MQYQIIKLLPKWSVLENAQMYNLLIYLFLVVHPMMLDLYTSHSHTMLLFLMNMCNKTTQPNYRKMNITQATNGQCEGDEQVHTTI